MNIKVKAKCEQCDYVAVHISENTAKAMLGRHRRFVHGVISPTAKYRKPVKAIGNSQSPAVTAPAIVERLIPSFCPCCGCSLAAVTAALNLRRKS